jgi:chorismate mutase/prephenate dehydratase
MGLQTDAHPLSLRRANGKTMPNPASAVDASPMAASKEEPPPNDGWRGNRPSEASHSTSGGPGQGLAKLRAELDRIDDAVHDLLMQRAKVVEQVARSGKPAAFRPGREASIIRRLVRRHHGSLPPVSLFRIWRELLAGTTAMQGRFSLAVSDPDPGAELTQLAREHFGALTPLRVYGSPGHALAEVSDGKASVAILPFPSDNNTWLVALLQQVPRLHVVGRLPFWRGRPDGAPAVQALVVAAAPADASAEDHSFLGLECSHDVSLARLSEHLAAAGLAADILILSREPSSTTVHGLAEIDGYLTDDDPRLDRIAGVLGRPVVIGSYAVPFGETPS